MWLFGTDEAKKHYNEGMRLSNTRAKYFDLMGAIEHLEQAVDLRPENPVYHCALGHLFVTSPILTITRNSKVTFDIRRSAGWAVDELGEALRLKPNYGWAACWLVVAYEYLGKRKWSIDTCRNILKYKLPRNQKTLAEYYLKALEKGTNENTNTEDATRRLQQVKAYGQAGEFTNADKEYEEACKYIPDTAWLFEVLCKMGKQDGVAPQPV